MSVLSVIAGRFEFDADVTEEQRQAYVERIRVNRLAFEQAQAAYWANPSEATFDGWWSAQEEQRLTMLEVKDCTVGTSYTEHPNHEHRLAAFR